jgi:predicted O-methyltransferase YrrM
MSKEYITHPNYVNHIDKFFLAKLEHLVEKYNINTIVETGIWIGNSTVFFAQLVEKVYGLEINPEFIEKTSKRLQDYNLNNVTLLQGHSSILLLDLMHKIDAERTIFFLDAHWYAYWPLFDEIDAISKNKGIIIVHDVKVPNANLGYDQWNGMELSYENLKPNLLKWSKNHKIEYNSENDGKYNPSEGILGTGIMYVYPK